MVHIKQLTHRVKRLYHKHKLHKYSLLVFAAIFGLVGLAFIRFVSAAPSVVSFEAENAILAGNATKLSDTGASGGQAVRFNGSAAVPDKRYVGVYFSNANDPLSMTYFGKYPEISTTYYQPNQLHRVVERETARIDRGTVPNLTLTSQGTNHLVGIADGEAASIAWIDSYVAGLKTVSEYAATKKMPVYATFEHEWEPKVNQGGLTGRATDPVVYAKSLDVFYQKIRQGAPLVTYIYWVAGHDHAKIGSVMNAMTVPPKIIAMDPYVNGTSNDTAAQNWLRYLDKFRKSNGQLYSHYNRLKTLVPASEGWEIKFAIAEHGFQTTDYIVNGTVVRSTNHTDAQVAAYFTNLRQQMIDTDIVFSIFFNSDRDTPYSITPGAVHPVPQAVTNFAQNMGL